MKKLSIGAKGWAMVIFGILCVYVSTAYKDSMNVAVYTFVERGWDQTHLLSLNSYGALASAVFTFIAGIYIHKGKLNVRRLMIISGLIFVVTTALWGVIPSQGLFTLNFLIQNIGWGIWMYQAVFTIIANWYPRKVGYVMGLVTIGFALAAAFGSTVFSKLNAAVGFAPTYFIFAAFGLAVVLYGYFAFSEYPEETGYYPDNDKSFSREELDAEIAAMKAAEAASPWTLKRVLKNPQMWCISVAIGALVMVASGSMGQMVVRFITGGIPMETAITLMIVVGLFNGIGSYIFGIIDTLTNVNIALKICLVFMICACILFSIDSFVPMVIGASMIGAALGAASNFAPSIVNYYWGRQNFNKIYSTTLVIEEVIGAFGAVSVANLAAAQSYSFAFKIMACVVVVAFVWFMTLKPGFVEKSEARFAEEDGKAA